MKNLSEKSQELLKFLRDEYIDSGFMYSGSWPYIGLKEHGFSSEDISSDRGDFP